MVVGAFPAAKLGTLLLRQISKPIATYLKEQAKASPIFRTYVCMPPAQFYNWCEIKTKMWILKMGTPVNIPVLNEAMAIELGANLLGEAIIFSIAAALLVNEYIRSAKKEAAKEAAKTDELQSLTSELQELFFIVEQQRVQIQELVRAVGHLDSSAIKLPRWSSQDRSPTEPPPPPPPAPSITPSPTLSLSHPSQDNKLVTSMQVKTDQSPGLILQAIENVENEFLNNREQGLSLGILTVALNYIFKDIYKVPLMHH